MVELNGRREKKQVAWQEFICWFRKESKKFKEGLTISFMINKNDESYSISN